MSDIIARPGGALASRPLHFFWVVDCSGSMSYDGKMEVVNTAIEECIPEMASAADNNPNAQLLIRALQFSSGASWLTAKPVPVEDYAWNPLEANGVTEMGKAFELLAAQLSIPPMPTRALPPVIVLLSDGQPTDSYKDGLNKGSATFTSIPTTDLTQFSTNLMNGAELYSMRMYSRALTPSEISENYAIDKARFNI